MTTPLPLGPDNVPLPFPEDWFPEDESENEDYVEERGEIWRIVGPPEDRDWQGKLSARFRKPYYSTYKGAKAALHYFPYGSKIQKGEVTWSELD
jgi:hypothetical protein